MVLIERSLLAGLLILMLSPCLSRACVIEEPREGAAWMKVSSDRSGHPGKAGVKDGLVPTMKMGLPGDLTNGAPGSSPALQAHRAKAGAFDGYFASYQDLGPAGEESETGSTSPSDPKLLFFLGAGFIGLGVAVKEVEKRVLKTAPFKENTPLPVSSLAGTALHAE